MVRVEGHREGKTDPAPVPSPLPPPPHLHSNARSLGHRLYCLVLLHPFQVEVGVFIRPWSTWEDRGGGEESGRCVGALIPREGGGGRGGYLYCNVYKLATHTCFSQLTSPLPPFHDPSSGARRLHPALPASPAPSLPPHTCTPSAHCSTARARPCQSDGTGG